MTRTLIVDGTKEVIANGRSSSMHAICNSTDYTHTRIVGYAHSLEDANLFAAAPEMQAALAEAEFTTRELCEGQDPANECWAVLGRIRAAISKSIGAAQ